MKKLNSCKKKISKSKEAKSYIFVVQKHFASRLHYDFRIQVGNVLKSWVIPKDPLIKTKEKRLAILTEDHPLSYAKFEGEIPQGEYGAGKVILWDTGTYKNIQQDEKGEIVSMEHSFEKGHIEIQLKGEKLEGRFALIHFKEKNWLFIKMKRTI